MGKETNKADMLKRLSTAFRALFAIEELILPTMAWWVNGLKRAQNPPYEVIKNELEISYTIFTGKEPVCSLKTKYPVTNNVS